MATIDTTSWWQRWVGNEEKKNISVDIFIGYQNGKFEQFENSFQVIVSETSTLQSIVEGIDTKVLKPIADYTSFGGTNSKIDEWIQKTKEKFKEDQFGNVERTNIYPYIYQAGAWSTLNPVSVLYRNPGIETIIEEFGDSDKKNVKFALYFFIPVATVLYSTGENEEVQHLRWKHLFDIDSNLDQDDKDLREKIKKHREHLHISPFGKKLRNDIPSLPPNKSWDNYKNNLIDLPWAMSCTPDEIVNIDDTPIPGTIDNGEIVDAYVTLDPGYAEKLRNAMYKPVETSLGEQMDFDDLPSLVQICSFCNFMTLQLAGLHRALLLRIIKTENFAIYRDDVERFMQNAKTKYAVLTSINKIQAKGEKLSSKDCQLMQKLLDGLDGQAPRTSAAQWATLGVAGGVAGYTMVNGITYTIAAVLGGGPATIAAAGTAAVIASFATFYTVGERIGGEETRQKRWENSLKRAEKEARQPSVLNSMRDKPMMAYYRIMALRNYVKAIARTITIVKERRRSVLITSN